MVLDVEDQDDFRFLVREPRSCLERYPRRVSLVHVIGYALADLLVLLLARNVEINFIKIKRHSFFLQKSLANPSSSCCPLLVKKASRAMLIIRSKLASPC